MKTEAQILDTYWGLLSNLNSDLKLQLIDRLSKSVDKDISTKKNRFEDSFGAWIDTRESEEIILELKNSRVFNREIESF
jgi:hypothetical protein